MHTTSHQPMRRPVAIVRQTGEYGETVTTLRLPKPRTTARREALREQGIAR